MDRHGGSRLGARGHPRGDCHSSRSRGRPRRRMRKRGPTGICEWLRKHRRRSRALRSTACLLRSHAVRSTPAPERHRVCQLQRPVGQRSRVQLSPLRMGLTVAVTGPTGEIGISAVTALEDDVDVDRIVGMARRPFKPASHGRIDEATSWIGGHRRVGWRRRRCRSPGVYRAGITRRCPGEHKRAQPSRDTDLTGETTGLEPAGCGAWRSLTWSTPVTSGTGIRRGFTPLIITGMGPSPTSTPNAGSAPGCKSSESARRTKSHKPARYLGLQQVPMTSSLVDPSCLPACCSAGGRAQLLDVSCSDQDQSADDQHPYRKCHRHPHGQFADDQ